MGDIIMRWGKQGGFGTQATTFKKVSRGNTNFNTIGEKNKYVKLGGGRGKKKSFPGVIIFNGSTDSSTGFRKLKYMFECLAGNNSVVGNKIKYNKSYISDYFTVDLTDEIEAMRFMNAVFNSLTITGNANSELNVKVDYFASEKREITVNTSGDEVLYDGSDLMYYKMCNISWGTYDIGSMVNSFTHMITNNIDPEKFLTISDDTYRAIRFSDVDASFECSGLYLDNKLRKESWGNNSVYGASKDVIKDFVVTYKDPNSNATLKFKAKAKIDVNTNTPNSDLTNQTIKFVFEYDDVEDCLFYIEYDSGGSTGGTV